MGVILGQNGQKFGAKLFARPNFGPVHSGWLTKFKLLQPIERLGKSALGMTWENEPQLANASVVGA